MNYENGIRVTSHRRRRDRKVHVVGRRDGSTEFAGDPANEHFERVNGAPVGPADYFAIGYSAIPLNAGTKSPPPPGVTGYRGRYTTTADLERYNWTGNVALRLPPDVVGVDVDVYNGGNGGLAELEEQFGKLTPTTWSTSRNDGSGIRLFRVPTGTTLRTNPAPGIDMVQYFHRYTVCHPSIHPDTRQRYRWIDELANEPVNLPPRPGELPELPWKWIEGLAIKKSARSPAATPDECAEFIDTHIEERFPEALEGVRKLLYGCQPGQSSVGRHDTLIKAACWGMRDVAAGRYAAAAVVELLQKWWRTVIDDPRRLGDGDFAGGEFGSAIAFAIGQTEADPRRVATIGTRHDNPTSIEALFSADPSTSEIIAEPNNESSSDTDEREGKHRSAASVLVDMAEAHYRFVQSAEGKPFGIPLDGPAIARPLDGACRSLRAELAAAYFDREGKAPTRSALIDAIAVIEGRAANADREPLALRIGNQDGRIIIDLGTTEGHAVVIGPGTVRVVDRPPTVFYRTELTSPLPRPDLTGTIGQLRDVVNMTRRDLPLYTGWLLAVLFNIPRPILYLTGEQGTGKSTAAKNTAQIIDPSPAPLRAGPRDLEGWIVAAAGSQVVALDNVSAIPEWLSDALCRASTGEGLVRRALYTDSALSVLSFRRAVALTSIDAGALRGDLGDRLVPVELEQITSDRRRTDAELTATFDRLHPQLFGALCQLAADVLEVLPTVVVPDLPRMADFGRILAALDQVRGWHSLDDYRRASEQVAADVVAGDPLASAVVAFATNRQTWTGTATELLELLAGYRPEGVGWPKTARTLSGALTRLAPALRTQVVEVRRDRTEHGRTITIALSERVTESRHHDANDANDTSPYLIVRNVQRASGSGSHNTESSAPSAASFASGEPF